jgi:hypothetical protein
MIPVARAGAPCTINELDRRELTIGDTSLYVEPTAIVGNDHGLMLAGFPNYMVSLRTGEVSRDKIFGVSLDSLGGVRTIPLPLENSPHSAVRALRHADEVHFGFAQSPPSSLTAPTLWHGRITRDGWADLDSLPSLGTGVYAQAAAELVSGGGSLFWSVMTQADSNSAVAVYERVGSSWYYHRLPVSRLTYLQMVSLPQGAALLTFRMTGGASGSVDFWPSEAGWRSLTVLKDLTESAHYPQVTRIGDLLVAAWQAGGAGEGVLEVAGGKLSGAWKRSYRHSTPVDHHTLLPLSQTRALVVARETSESGSMLRFVDVEATAAGEILARPLVQIGNPFEGGTFTARSPRAGIVVVSGPKFFSDPPRLSTLLISFRVDCTSS